MKTILFSGQFAEQFSRAFPPSFYENFTVDYVPLKKEYDIVAIFENCDVDTITVKAKKIIFISGEPKTIISRPDSFFKQFDCCYVTYGTSQNIITRQFSPWHIGLFANPVKYDFTFFKNTSFTKTKIITGITSNKKYTEGHLKRYNFCLECSKAINGFDLFGRGIKDFNDKIDFLPQYKYNIVIENCSTKDYWTEKLADSFLAECYTFYYGCPNIKDYFPENSFTIIDINNIKKSIEIIKKEIINNTYEKNILEIKKSKQRILDNYNICSIFNIDRLGSRSRKRKIKYPYPQSFLHKLKTLLRGIIYNA